MRTLYVHVHGACKSCFFCVVKWLVGRLHVVESKSSGFQFSTRSNRTSVVYFDFLVF